MMPNRQAVDATICSNDSGSYASQASLPNTSIKQSNKVRAYVDFSDFNKNYEEYLRRKGASQAAAKSDDIKKEPELLRIGSCSSSQRTTDDWVLISTDKGD